MAGKTLPSLIRCSGLGLLVLLFLAGCLLCLTALSQPRGQGPGAPLEGVVEAMALLAGLVLLLAGSMGFIFFLRQPVQELLGEKLNADHVRLVTERTAIVFPPTARLVGLCHEGESMSVKVATKFELPESCREGFMQNPIFHTGIDRPPHYELGSSTAWWRRNSLQSRIDRVQYLPSCVYVECSIGTEGGKTVVYVSWA